MHFPTDLYTCNVNIGFYSFFLHCDYNHSVTSWLYRTTMCFTLNYTVAVVVPLCYTVAGVLLQCVTPWMLSYFSVTPCYTLATLWL